MCISKWISGLSPKFNVLALENNLVALTGEIGDGPCFLYIKISWIGVLYHVCTCKKFALKENRKLLKNRNGNGFVVFVF